MGLFIEDDTRPGYALLNFGRDLNATQISFSIKSKKLRADEYLRADGKWSKIGFFFTAHNTGKTGQYRIGPEIVNRGELAYDDIEISLASSSIVENINWPELTPAASLSDKVHGSATDIYRDETPGNLKLNSEGTTTKNNFEIDTEKTFSNISNNFENKSEESYQIKASEPYLNEPESDKFEGWKWIAVSGIVVAAIVLLLFFSHQYCVPISFLSQKCKFPNSSFTKLENCLAGKLPCDGKTCFEIYFQTASSKTLDRSQAEKLRNEWDNSCQTRQASFQSAQSCAQGKQANDPCGAKQCFAPFVLTEAGSEADRLSAQAQTDKFSQRCADKIAQNLDEQARNRAINCIEQSPWLSDCKEADRCVAEYERTTQNGIYLTDLIDRANQKSRQCDLAIQKKNELQQQENLENDNRLIAFNCANNRSDCRAKQKCYNIYTDAYPNGRYITEFRSILAALRCSSLPDGIYSGFAPKACSGSGIGMEISICNSQISWVHNFNQIDYRWSGTINSDGGVSAQAIGRPGSSAYGQMTETDKSLSLKYPECPAPLKLRITTLNKPCN